LPIIASSIGALGDLASDRVARPLFKLGEANGQSRMANYGSVVATHVNQIVQSDKGKLSHDIT
jgi:hypothetical protein